MELNRRNIEKILGIITFSALIFYSVNHLSVLRGIAAKILSLLFPFILGFAIAFVLNTPMMMIEKRVSLVTSRLPWLKRFNRIVSLVLSYIFLFGMIWLVLFLLIPDLVHTFEVLVINSQNFFTEFIEHLNMDPLKASEWIAWIDAIQIDWQGLINDLRSMLSMGASTVITSTIGVAMSIVSGLIEVFLGFVFSIYLLLQKEKLCYQCKQVAYAYLSQKHANMLVDIVELSNKAFSNFLSGQCVVALILGTMFFVTMSIFKFPYVLIISVFISFTALIPVFGAFIGCIVGILLICTVSISQAFWFIVLFLVLQQIEENFIYPRVVGNSVGLPSIWVLVAVTLGGSMMGILGMLIFIPIFSVLYTLFKRQVHQRLKQKKVVIK